MLSQTHKTDILAIINTTLGSKNIEKYRPAL